MDRFRLVTLGVGLTVCGLLYVAVATGTSNAQVILARQEETLGQKVERLERKTADLQRQVDDLKRRAQVTTLALPQNAIAPGHPVPPGAKPFRFNGMTYYLTPVRNATAPAAKSAVNEDLK